MNPGVAGVHPLLSRRHNPRNETAVSIVKVEKLNTIMRIPVSIALCLAITATGWTGCSKAGSTTASAVTYLSVIHGAPYTSAATIFLNDTLITQSAGIATGAYSPKYGTIRPGNYAVKFEKAGTDSIIGQIPASAYDTLGFYTLLLYNGAGGQGAHVIKIADDYSVVTSNNSAYYRFFNLAPDCASVNVYFNGTLMQATRTPADNAAVTWLNDFKSITPGTYTVTVKDAYTDSLLLTSPSLTLSTGNPFTIWITGLKSNKSLSINMLQAQY